MGLMSFFKGVGEKLFPSTEEVPEVKAAALLAHVQGLGLPFKKLSVKVAEDVVTLEGMVAEQVDSEKIAIAVGNVEGVSSVNNDLEVEVPKEFKKIVEDIEKMTVMELNQLVKVFEEKFGVSATAVAVFLFKGCRKHNFVKWSWVCMMNLFSPSGCDCISIRSVCHLCQALWDRTGLTTKPFLTLDFFKPHFKQESLNKLINSTVMLAYFFLSLSCIISLPP